MDESALVALCLEWDQGKGPLKRETIQAEFVPALMPNWISQVYMTMYSGI